VAECAVIGVFDPLRDEAVKAVIVLRHGATPCDDELTEWCGRYLARFKVPTVFEYRDALPKTSIGKIKKYQLRAEHDAANPR
jgi:crotonobetaine/carnitine-CoA ligase